MSLAVLEINDLGVCLVVDGEPLPPSPGYASFGREEIMVGDAAAAVARLQPHNVTNRFWHDLDEQPLGLLAAAGRSNADLAFEHLNEVCGPQRGRFEKVVALVPGSMQPRQLMLLLGIAREAELPMAGFLDAAVAAAAAWGGRGRFIHVELHQHQAILTAVEADTQVRRDRIETAPRAGWAALSDRWAKLIASQFVARTRFDPLHVARSEQNLFEALPAWLAQSQSERQFEVQITLGGEQHQVTLSRELIEAEARPLYDQILLAAHRLRRAGHATTIGLGPWAARLPGLIERFTEFHDCDVAAFAAGAIPLAAAALDLPWSLDEHNASLVRTAPSLASDEWTRLRPSLVQRAQSSPAAAAPTHALYRGKAHAVGLQPLLIGTGGPQQGVAVAISEAGAGISRVHCSLIRSAEGAMVIDHSRYGTWLNDERVIGRAPLRAGDRLRLGSPGIALELIAIE